MKDERDEYWGDALYSFWLNGGNPDSLSRSRTENARRSGLYPDEFARREILRIRRHRRERQGEYDEEGY